MVYGGTISAGCTRGEPKLDIVSAFQAYGEFIAGKITEDERHGHRPLQHAPAPAPAAACTPPTRWPRHRSARHVAAVQLVDPGRRPAKLDECVAAGKAIRNLLENDLKPRDIMTREAFENAMTMVMALGGSTNAVLHLIAMARAVNVPLTIDDFQQSATASRTRRPQAQRQVRDGRPARRRRHAGGDEVPAREGLLDGDCMTVTGKTLAENLARSQGLDRRPEDHRTRSKRRSSRPATSASCAATLPRRRGRQDHRQGRPALHRPGQVLRLRRRHAPRPRAKEDRQGRRRSSSATKARRAGPACPRCSPTPAPSWAPASGKNVALITDGRFSGGSHGFIVGHVTPEAQEGGPIALVQDGDTITIDAEQNTINVEISDEELASRKARWNAPPYKATRDAV